MYWERISRILKDPAGMFDRGVDTETRVPPIGKAGGDLGTDKFLLYKELDDYPAEILRHSVEVSERDMDKPAGLIEPAFQHKAVEMGISSQKAPADWN